jgi:hypothetical protein
MGPRLVATSNEPPNEMTNDDFQVTVRLSVFDSGAMSPETVAVVMMCLASLKEASQQAVSRK